MTFRLDHYTKDKMLRFRRVGTTLVAAVYGLTNVAATYAVETGLWEERRSARQRAPQVAGLLSSPQRPILWKHFPFDGGSSTSQPPSTFKRLAVPFDVASAVLPYGAIGEVQEGRRGAPVVFLVQDVHGNEGAQKNIGGLLTALASRGVAFSGLEGAAVPLDLDPYHRHPVPQAVRLVADALRVSGRLSGAEWAGLISTQSMTLSGIESAPLYKANLASAKECVARRPATDVFLSALNKTLQSQKNDVYSVELKSFDRHRESYGEGREGLSAYSRFLGGLPGGKTLVGPQVKKFLCAVEWETYLNFSQVESDRRSLMDELSKGMRVRDLEELLSRAVAYRAGQTTNGDFFAFLRSLCQRKGYSLDRYPHFRDYLDYVGVIEGINRKELMTELAQWEIRVGDTLARNDTEKNLLALDRDAALLSSLLENEMSPEKWVTYQNNRNSILALPGRLGGADMAPFQELSRFVRPHEDFCRLAMDRNSALAENFAAQVQAKKATQGVLVAGGFHTPGLQSELSKRGYSTVVITPRIQKVEGKPLDVFARDPLPFDTLFAGKPISLSPELTMGSQWKKLVDMALTAEGLGGPSAVNAVKQWARGRGIQVTQIRNVEAGVLEIQLVLAGETIHAVVGPRARVQNRVVIGLRLMDSLLLGNDHVVQMYGRALFQRATLFKRLGRLVFLVFKKVLTLFFHPDGRRLFFSTGQIGVSFNKIMTLFFMPFNVAAKFWIIPAGRPNLSQEDPFAQRGVKFEVDREGLGIKLKMVDSKGNVTGSLVLLGFRGEATLSNIKLHSENPKHGLALLSEAARMALFDGRKGRLFIPRVEGKHILKAAMSLFDRRTLLVGKSKYDRSVRDVRWKDRMNPLDDDGIMGLLETPSQTVDIGGSLPPQGRQRLWAEMSVSPPSAEDIGWNLPAVQIVKDESRGLDVYQIIYEGEIAGSMIVKVQGDVVIIMKTEVYDKPVNLRGRGIGSAAIMHFTRIAARILAPRENSEGVAVPLERRNIVNPWIFKHAVKRIFEPDSIEIVEVGTQWPLYERTDASDWDHAIRSNHPRFAFLTSPENVNEKGEYIIRFHMRGKLQDSIYSSARSETAERASFPPLLSDQLKFNVSGSATVLKSTLTDPSGREVGRATVEGKRGAIVIRNTHIEQGDPSYAFHLLAETARQFLLLKGQGRVLLPAVKDPRVKQAAKMLFRETFLLAPAQFGRRLSPRLPGHVDPASSEFSQLMNIATSEVDIVGSLTPESRLFLWPNEDLPPTVTGEETSAGPVVIFSPSNDRGLKHKLMDFNGSETHLNEISIDGKNVGNVVFSVKPRKVILKNIKINDDKQNQKFGAAALEALAKIAALLLHPEVNSRGQPCPLEIRLVRHPLMGGISMKVFETGTMEVVAVGSKYEADEDDPDFSWDRAYQEGSPEFTNLIGEENIGPDGDYKTLFHLRGKVSKKMVEAADRESLQKIALENGVSKVTEPLRIHPIVFFNSFGLPALLASLGLTRYFSKDGTVEYARIVSDGLHWLRGILKSQIPVPPQNHPSSPDSGGDTGVTVASVSVLNSLQDDERKRMVVELRNMMPRAEDLGGLDVSVDPNRLAISGIPGRVDGPPINNTFTNALLLEIASKLADPQIESIAWAGRLSLRAVGETALSVIVKTAAQNGEAALAGVALAALDDGLRYPQGPDREKIIDIMTALFQGEREGALQRVQTFAEFYNRVRSDLLSVRTVGGQVGGKPVLLDLTVLFKNNPSEEEKTRQAETWLVLGGTLSALSQDKNSRFALIVRDPSISREQVQAMLRKAEPPWDMRAYFKGDSLILASESNAIGGYFNQTKFSLGALRQGRGVWKVPVLLVGFDSESLLETEDILKKWGAVLISLSHLLDKEIERIIKKLEFVRISA
jgi:hypothetical protein